MGVLKQAVAAVHVQRELLRRKDAEISILQQSLLLSERAYILLAQRFRENLDEEEDGVREALDTMIVELADYMARIEEHVL